MNKVTTYKSLSKDAMSNIIGGKHTSDGGAQTGRQLIFFNECRGKIVIAPYELHC